MKFTVYDFSEYFGSLILDSDELPEDELWFSADVSEAWDEDAEEWSEEAIRLSAERKVKERFGSSAVILWE